MSSPYGAARYQGQSKGLAVTSLVLGIVSLVTCGGLLVGALAGLVLGIMAAMRADRQPAEYGGKGIAIGGIVTSALSLLLVPIVGIMAAIAIPSLLRARVSANESATIGDIRTVISAQAAYQSVNGGFYEGRLECLATPTQCLPDYTGPTFLPAAMASLQTKSGYRRRFETGPSQQATGGGKVSPTSVGAWAYIAVPANQGNTGVRGFCGDASGIICYTTDGSAPGVRDGACDVSSCHVLQ